MIYKKETTVISVIIPTFNRCRILEKCLSAMEKQTVDKTMFEVIVADDGSVDNTRKIVESFILRDQIKLIYLKQINSGANRARNYAISKACGVLILFINDDIILDESMLLQHISSHKKHPQNHVGILGHVTIDKNVPYSPFAKLHLDAVFNNLKGSEWLNWKYFFTCNVSVKKIFLTEYGLFDEKMHYHEDIELGERLSRNGFIIKYNKNAKGYHHHFLKEEEFFKIAVHDGRALVMWYNKSPYLKTTLADIGFYPGEIFFVQIKYFAADFIINKKTIPYFLLLTKKIVKKNETIALMLYRKIFQAIKREAITCEISCNKKTEISNKIFVKMEF